VRVEGVILVGTLTLLQASAHSDEPCGEAQLGFSLSFSLSNVESRTQFDGILGGTRGEGKVVIGVGEGMRGKARTFVSIVTSIEGEYFRSVQAWDLSMIVEGAAVPVGASFQRSAGATYSHAAFDATHILDPSENEGMRGVVSNVVLGFHIAGFLPAIGTTSVLELEIEEVAAHEKADTATIVRFQDGLRAPPMGPVFNRIYLRGDYTVPCNEDTASLELIFSLDGPRFLRGDSNGDGRLELSDAVFLLRGLFEESRSDACPASSDANGDGRLDIADAVYLLAYLFRGGRSPPDPFPNCGLDVLGERESLPCPELPAGCR
jgi:hypothetical protein